MISLLNIVLLCAFQDGGFVVTDTDPPCLFRDHGTGDGHRREAEKARSLFRSRMQRLS